MTTESENVERSEDVLTSAVFGTLLVAGAWDVLATWLRRAEPVGGADALVVGPEEPHAYWFWPWLHGAEPDVVMRLGDTLVVVEAKFYSSKSGDDGLAVEGGRSADQLVREWDACSPAADASRYPPLLRDAMRECSARRLVYLVRRNRAGHEMAQVEASATKAAGASMYLLTWEHLHEVLAERSGAQWMGDLRQYLEDKKLAAFRGFTKTVVRHEALGLDEWRKGREPRRDGARFGAAFPRERLALLRGLASRVGPQTEASEPRWRQVIRVENTFGLRALAEWSSAFEKESR